MSAHTAHIPSDGPAFQVSVGFSSRFRDGNWTPVRVALRNDGPDFTGAVSVNIPAQFTGSNTPDIASIYQEPISLPTGSQKQVTIYAPFLFGVQGASQNVTVDLLDNTGRKVSTHAGNLTALQSNDAFIGILSDQSTGFGPLSEISLPSQPSSVILESLSADTMPTNAAILGNFNLIVLDNFDTSTLSQEQLNALQRWVTQGGSLVAIGGPEWRRTLSPLPLGLLPVSINATTTIPAGTSLLPVGGPTKSGPGPNTTKDSVQAPIVVSAGTLTTGHILLSSGTTPLIAQSSYGQGTVSYLAFDPTLDPVVSWSGSSSLWKGILLRSLGEQAITQAQNQYGAAPISIFGVNKFNPDSISGMLQTLLPSSFPSVWLILILLFSYILILGPLRMVLARRLKKRDWSWRIALATIAVFSLLSYGLALQQKGTSVLSDSISIVQLSNSKAPGSTAHITTYLGVFVPNQGDFHVHIPSESLVQPNDSAYQQSSRQQTSQTIIASAQNTTDVDLRSVDIWTLRSIIAEHDRQLQGGITSKLTVSAGNLDGSVTNTLPYSLSDAYVLVGSQYIGLGYLAAGQTEHVHLTLSDPNFGNYPPPLIASQIASNSGFPSSGSYDGTSQPQNDFQRHLAILSSLSGGNGNTYCNANGVCYQARIIRTTTRLRASIATVPLSAGSQTIVYSGGGPIPQFRDHDPLTISNAPATFIGWADPQSDLASDFTINGDHPSGRQEIMIQAPLDLTFSGPFSLNPNFISGQLIDIQGTNTQLVSQGVYTMGTGSVTYEYLTPNKADLHVGTLIVSQIPTLNQIVPQQGSGNQTDANHLQIHLYNWRTHGWDNFAFNQFTLSVPNAQSYIGSEGRIIIQLANTDTSSTQVLFNKPILQLQGDS